MGKKGALRGGLGALFGKGGMPPGMPGPDQMPSGPGGAMLPGLGGGSLPPGLSGFGKKK